MVATNEMEPTTQEALDWSDLCDMNGKPLAVGTLVDYAIGSKLRTGMCIVPEWIYPKPRRKKAAVAEQEVDDEFDDEEDDDGDSVAFTVPMPGVLIYNHNAPNRKNVYRACADIRVHVPA